MRNFNFRSRQSEFKVGVEEQSIKEEEDYNKVSLELSIKVTLKRRKFYLKLNFNKSTSFL